jgi:ATP synthase I chain
MDEKHLIAVEKVTLALAAVVIGAALIALSRHAAFGVTLGAGLMVLNALALRRIGVRAFRTFKRPGAAILLFNAKMAVLIGVVYLVIRYVHVDPVAFVIGISIFPVAIVIVAIKHMLAAPAAASTETKNDG